MRFLPGPWKGPAVKIRILAVLGFCCFMGIIILGGLQVVVGVEGPLGLYRLGQWILVGLVAYIVYRLFAVTEYEIVRPLADTAWSLERMAQGGFDHQLPVESDDEIGRLRVSINHLTHRLKSMSRLVEEINSGATFEETFDYMFNSMQGFVPYDRIGVALLDDDGRTLRTARARSKYSIYLGTGYSGDIHKSSLAQVIESGRPRILNDLVEYLRQHPNSHSTQLIVKEGMKSSITLPLTIGNRCIGVLFFSSVQANTYSERHIDFLRQ